MRLTVRVPATVANLGPGFDAFGLALSLHNEITVDTDAGASVAVEGEGADELPTDETNLVVRAMARMYSHWRSGVAPVSVHCVNRIPLERGLGSSAAAIVGGLLLADRMIGPPSVDRSELLAMAVELEGHADNAAAALLGGLVIAHDGVADRFDPSPDLRPVMLIPDDERVGTEEARRALTPQVSREDATFNAAHAGLLALAMTSRTDLLAVAMQDRLHQDARLRLAPKAAALFETMHARGIPVCVAGSGPTLLAFDTGDAPVPEPGAGWRALRLDVARNGAEVVEPG